MSAVGSVRAVRGSGLWELWGLRAVRGCGASEGCEGLGAMMGSGL